MVATFNRGALCQKKPDVIEFPLQAVEYAPNCFITLSVEELYEKVLACLLGTCGHGGGMGDVPSECNRMRPYFEKFPYKPKTARFTTACNFNLICALMFGTMNVD